MEDIEKNTFEWSVDRFLERKGEEKRSSKFEIWRETCNLFVPARDGNSSVISQYLTLYLESILKSTCREGRSLKLCLIGRNGKEVFVVNRTLLQKLPYDQFLLMTFREQELRENAHDLLPEGTLTVRLSWYENRDDKRPKKLETLSKDLACLYVSKANTDCILRVGDAQFPVHRAVLSARSEVFAAMFHHDTSETQSGVVDIPDVEATILDDFLHYLYSGKAHGLTTNTACPLYVVADKYALIELKNICVEFLMSTLTIESICNAAVLAHTHGEEKLQKKVVQFIQDKMEEVQESVEWKMLCSSKPSLVIKLLSFTVLACKDKIKAVSEK